MKLLRSWMFVAQLLPLALVYTAADMAKAGNPISPDFVAKVTDVSGHGVVVFESIGARRLWGLLIVDADYLRELIVGKTMSCVDAGETHGSWGGGDQKIHIPLLSVHTRK